MIPLGQTKNMDIFLLMPAPGQWDKFIAETAAGIGATKSAWPKQNEQLLKNLYETAFSCPFWKMKTVLSKCKVT